MKREPAVILSLLGALLNLAVAFGWHLTDIQLASIDAFLMAAVGYITRQVVYSPATIDNAAGMVKELAARAKRKRKGLE